MSYTIDEWWTDRDGIQRIQDEYYRYGLIDSCGRVIIPCKYSELIRFDEDVRLAAVKRDGKWGYINTLGREVVSCEYEYVSDTFYCGRAEIRKYGKSGFIDGSGCIVINCQYDTVSIFWDGMASVCRNGKYGIIDTRGNEIFSISYDYIGLLGDGILVAGKKNWIGRMKYCLLNYNGRHLTDYDYDKIGDRILSNGMILYQKGTEHGYLNKQGDEHQTFG